MKRKHPEKGGRCSNQGVYQSIANREDVERFTVEINTGSPVVRIEALAIAKVSN
jgi:hypothetical protein